MLVKCLQNAGHAASGLQDIYVNLRQILRCFLGQQLAPGPSHHPSTVMSLVVQIRLGGGSVSNKSSGPARKNVAAQLSWAVSNKSAGTIPPPTPYVCLSICNPACIPCICEMMKGLPSPQQPYQAGKGHIACPFSSKPMRCTHASGPPPGTPKNRGKT